MAFINPDKVPTDALASLVKQIDKVVGENKDKKLASFVNLIGEDRDALEEKAKKLGDGLDNVAVVVPVEFELGPKNFGVNPKASATVMVYKGAKVETNIAVEKVDGKVIESVVKAAKELVN